MNPQYDAYLLGNAFGAGEFQSSQQQFDQAASTLGLILSSQVAEVMRSHLSKTIAADWVGSAVTVLDQLVATAPEPGEALQLVEEMQRSLQDRPGLRNETIESEIRAFGWEAAQLVLARWYAALHALPIPREGLALNANMLPGTQSTEELLQPLDFGSFGVKPATVALAVRAYRQVLIDGASDGIIAFAPQLFLLHDPSKPELPFRCFGSADDAAAAAAAAAKARAEFIQDYVEAAEHLLEEETWRQLVALLEAIRGATSPAGAGLDVEVLSKAVALLVDALPSVAQPAGSSVWSALPGPWFEPTPGAEKAFQESISLGVDILSAGMSANLDEAKCILDDRAEPIKARLFEYAGARDMKIGPVADMYAISVAAGISVQFGQMSTVRVREKPAQFRKPDHSDRMWFLQTFQDTHHLSHEATTLLMRDSHRGAAYIAYPAG